MRHCRRLLALLRFLLFFQHCPDVPGQQRLDLLDDAGSGQMLEQIVHYAYGSTSFARQVMTVRAALTGGAKRRALTNLPRSVQSRGGKWSYRFLDWGMAAFSGSLYFSKVCTISERAVTTDDGVISLPLPSPVSSCLNRLTSSLT